MKYWEAFLHTSFLISVFKQMTADNVILTANHFAATAEDKNEKSFDCNTSIGITEERTGDIHVDVGSVLDDSSSIDMLTATSINHNSPTPDDEEIDNGGLIPNLCSHGIAIQKQTFNQVAAHSNSLDEADSSFRRPLKKPRTAYFIFADQKRKEVQKEHLGEGITAVARVLGQLWSNMSPEEKQIYLAKSVEERKLYDAATHFSTADATVADVPAGTPSDGAFLLYPLGRIRKICKLDPEVRGMSKEALLLVAKAAEIFTSSLGIECIRIAQIQNRRKLVSDDLVQACSVRDRYVFLREDVKDLANLQETHHFDTTHTVDKKKKPTTSSVVNSRMITSFFTSRK